MSSNLISILGSFEEKWSPRVVTTINDYDVKVAKIDGDFCWHSHETTDELFMVLSGSLTINERERKDGPVTRVVLGPMDVYVVKKGIEHFPQASDAQIMLFEPRGTVNVGDTQASDASHLVATVGKSLVTDELK